MDTYDDIHGLAIPVHHTLSAVTARASCLRVRSKTALVGLGVSCAGCGMGSDACDVMKTGSRERRSHSIRPTPESEICGGEANSRNRRASVCLFFPAQGKNKSKKQKITFPTLEKNKGQKKESQKSESPIQNTKTSTTLPFPSPSFLFSPSHLSSPATRIRYNVPSYL